jgi:hypothetical protein
MLYMAKNDISPENVEETGSSIGAVLHVFTEKLSGNTEWKDELEQQKIFSPPELKRVEFLLALLSYFEHPQDWKNPEILSLEDLENLT